MKILNTKKYLAHQKKNAKVINRQSEVELSFSIHQRLEDSKWDIAQSRGTNRLIWAGFWSELWWHDWWCTVHSDQRFFVLNQRKMKQLFCLEQCSLSSGAFSQSSTLQWVPLLSAFALQTPPLRPCTCTYQASSIICNSNALIWIKRWLAWIQLNFEDVSDKTLPKAALT